jgi:hypothetical protein
MKLRVRNVGYKETINQNNNNNNDDSEQTELSFYNEEIVLSGMSNYFLDLLSPSAYRKYVLIENVGDYICTVLFDNASGVAFNINILPGGNFCFTNTEIPYYGQMYFRGDTTVKVQQISMIPNE